jgi:glyoxylase-like metal-dependent hydrolase (beta-lactamase superfamily II)
MFRRLVTITVALLGVVLVMPHAAADEIASVVPAAKRLKFGDLDLWVLRDSRLIVPNDGTVFGLNANPAAVAKVLSEAGASTDKVPLDVDVLLIKLPGHLVLADSGWGVEGHGVLQQSLKLAGLSLDDITDVLITHAHTDHAGGLIDAQGRPSFRKAVIRMSANEWTFMQNQAETRTLAMAIKAQIRSFEPGKPILPGITPIALYGHTPGHVGYEISSRGQRLLDIGDLAHSAVISLAKPDWLIDYDTNKADGARQRRLELERLADAQEFIFAPHFPFPGVGLIKRSRDGFEFYPQMPSDRPNVAPVGR